MCAVLETLMPIFMTNISKIRIKCDGSKVNQKLVYLQVDYKGVVDNG